MFTFNRFPTLHTIGQSSRIMLTPKQWILKQKTNQVQIDLSSWDSRPEAEAEEIDGDGGIHDPIIRCISQAISDEMEAKTKTKDNEYLDVIETGAVILEAIIAQSSESEAQADSSCSVNAVWDCLNRSASSLAVPNDVYGDSYAAISMKRPRVGIINPKSNSKDRAAAERDGRYCRALKIMDLCLKLKLNVKEQFKPNSKECGELIASLACLMSPNGTWCSDTTQNYAKTVLEMLGMWVWRREIEDQSQNQSKMPTNCTQYLIILWKSHISDWTVSHVLPQDLSNQSKSMLYPPLCAFEVLMSNLRHPHVSSSVGLIIAVSLNAADSTSPHLKLMGAKLMNVCVKEVNAAELRWHSEVLMRELSAMIRLKDPHVLQTVVPVAVEASIVLDPSVTGEYRTLMMDALLHEMTVISTKENRIVYSDVLPIVFEAQGAALIRDLGKWWIVLFDQLLCGDADIAMKTLDSMLIVMKHCWVRIPAHQKLLFQAMCQCCICYSDNEEIEKRVEDVLVRIWELGVIAVKKRIDGDHDHDHVAAILSEPDSDWNYLLSEAQDIPPLVGLVKRLKERVKE